MPRKVLISFIGTGVKGTERKYETATYQIGEEPSEMYTTSFIADALASYYKIDVIILIGTVKSMWEAVYEAFCHKNDLPADENYCLELWEHCEKSNHNSPQELPCMDKIESALGKGSKIILIKYGLNQQELDENMSTILGIEQYLKNGDSLYVDITHSFRSLPLFLMNSLIYMKNVSPKNIIIEHIFYGMFEAKRELGYTPVLDLKNLMIVNDWISGAYSFMEFGNAYKIAELLRSLGGTYTSAGKRLKKFSDIKNLNHLNAMESQILELKAIRTSLLPDIARYVVPPVIKDFLHHFEYKGPSSQFQYELACWHYKKHNYSASYITFVEAIITYVCEKCMFDENSKDDRDLAKEKLMKSGDFKELRSIYGPINSVRKQIAHSLKTDKSVSDMINILDENLKRFRSIIYYRPSSDL